MTLMGIVLTRSNFLVKCVDMRNDEDLHGTCVHDIPKIGVIYTVRVIVQAPIPLSKGDMQEFYVLDEINNDRCACWRLMMEQYGFYSWRFVRTEEVELEKLREVIRNAPLLEMVE